MNPAVRNPAPLVAAAVLMTLAGCGGGGGSSTGGGGTTPTNTAPVATAITVSASEDAVKTGTLAATDADGDALTYAITVQPQHGAVVAAGNAYTYTPAPNYSGSDSFTFRATDTKGAESTAVVTLTVTNTNDAPTVAPGSGPLTIHSGGYGLTQVGLADAGRATLLLADGTILVAGDTVPTGQTTSGILLARYAAAGVLHPNFGTGGKTVVSAGVGLDRAYALAVDTNGKILVAGESWDNGVPRLSLLRFTAAGALDPTFDGDGIVTITSLAGAGAGVAVQGDKVVLVGLTISDTNLDGLYNSADAASTDFVVARFNANGSPDSTFDGDGLVVTPIGPGANAAQAVAIDAANGILVAGSAQGGGGTQDFALARYLSTGTLDPAFGTGGVVTTDVSGGADAAAALQVQADGKILLAGTATSTDGGDFAAVRYSATGTPDGTFGTAGIVKVSAGAATADSANTLTLAGNGILLGGWANPGGNTAPHFALLKLTAAGVVDTTFGTSGWVATQPGTASQLWGLAVQADGKIVATGWALSTTPQVAMARYSASGALDPGFADDGINLAGEAFSFTLPASRFVDLDAGDTLTFTGTLADGSALPGTITFTDTTLTFAGTVPTLPAGLKVTARDSANATGSETYAFAP
jgi:uncharacterized delta-60 repeat protein